MNTMRVTYLFATVLVFATLIATLALAQDKPPVPNTGVYVTDIDNDWVELSIAGVGADGSVMFIDEAEEVTDRIFSNGAYGGELMDLATFACSLYKRNAVYLSMEYETKKSIVVTRIRFLFACAIPAGQ